MAYFSALGGTGGTSATITVTYSEDFYGLTITATNGTTTLTKTATSSGTLVFDVSEGGTWVVSGTVEGATYSESVDVTFEYTAPPLVALPDGSTALPVNDIQMWLKCAGIRDKDYTTLSQVLADTETFIALCADSNACDYMARSTNWASGVAADSTAMLIVGKYNYCANKLLSNSTWNSAIRNSTYWESVLKSLIPTMTGYTTPSGEVIYNGTPQNNYLPWHAFNSDGTSGQVNIGQNVYLGYGFEEPKQINKMYFYYIHFSITSNPNAVIQIIASDDKTTWEVLKDNISVTVSGYTTTFEFDNNTAYKYYAVRLKSYSAGSSFGWFYCEMYGRTDNANYIPLVPVMTSNTTPSGECTASTVYGTGYEAYRAFDGDSTTRCAPYNTSNVSVDHYVAYEFENPCIVDKAVVTIGGTNTPSRTYKFQGYNGTNWIDVSESFTNASGTFEHIIDTQRIAYQGYRIFYPNCILWVRGSYSVDITELQFYRKSDLPIIHSAVEDSIFYMNDGSPVALCGIPVGDTIDVDLEAYKGQTLTLVSTVAKDPTNLSNDFSMNVRITPNITEIYLMPIKYLYWWGNMSDNCEELSNANGWNYGDTYQSPTYNKNDVFVRGGSNIIQGIGSKYAINGTTYNHLKYIVKSNNYYGGAGVILGALSTKGGTTWTVNESPQSISSPTLETVDISSYASNFALFWANDNTNRYGALNAFWYE